MSDVKEIVCCKNCSSIEIRKSVNNTKLEYEYFCNLYYGTLVNPIAYCDKFNKESKYVSPVSSCS